MKNKKSLFIVIIGLIAIFLICLLIIYLNPSNNEENNITSGSNNISDVMNLNIVDNTVSSVTDSDLYFSLMEIINDYLSSKEINNEEKMIAMLDSNFVKNNNIDKTTIYNYLLETYSDTFYAKKIYVKKINSTYYFYLNGDILSVLDLVDNASRYYTGFNYMIVVSNNNFSIIPLEKNIDLRTYAINYKISEKIINSNNYNSFSISSYESTSIFSLYLSYFKNVLIMNSNRAYDLLNSSYKGKFSSYDDFYNNINEVYNKINGTIRAYDVEVEGNTNKYSLSLSTNYKIIFYETGPMEFNVEIR